MFSFVIFICFIVVMILLMFVMPKLIQSKRLITLPSPPSKLSSNVGLRHQNYVQRLESLYEKKTSLNSRSKVTFKMEPYMLQPDSYLK